MTRINSYTELLYKKRKGIAIEKIKTVKGLHNPL